VEIRGLNVGDYAVGESTVIERKTALDLSVPLGHGRFWRQIGELQACCGDPILLVEGHVERLPTHRRESVRGACIAVHDMGIPLISSESREETSRWIHRLATRRLRQPARRDRPIWSQRSHPRSEAPHAVLACIPGVSSHLSERLLTEFGSVAAVAQATVEQLTEIPGIGPIRAKDIRETLVGHH